MPTRPCMTERIIEESVRLFVQKGFKGTTIKDITDSVNLTRGANGIMKAKAKKRAR